MGIAEGTLAAAGGSLAGATGVERSFSPASDFPRQFEQQVAKAADSVALIFGSQHVTYGELEEQTRRLRNSLLAKGAGPETRVGMLVGCTLPRITAAVAILRAGATYVPLDEAAPRDRLRRVARIADLTLLVTDQDAADGVVDATIDVVEVPAGRLPGTGPISPELPRINSRQAAYVIFTSGSTGMPKGVVVPHGALAWYCRACIRHYQLAPGDRLLQLASIGFDISIGEIFPTLSCGATLILGDDETRRDDIFGLSRRHAVTVLFPPTALWHELAEMTATEPAALPATLRLVSFGGESVRARSLELWRRHVGSRVRLVNGYGPTEATVEATHHDVTAHAADNEHKIGHAIEGVEATILDHRLRSVDDGQVGELTLAGPGLARGYFRHPAATAGRFVPHDASPRPGARRYLTGDRCRQTATGIELLGRFDDQTKIRGFLVHPREVEAALMQQSAVKEAMVLPFSDNLGAYLVAWIVPADHSKSKNTLQHGILGVGGSHDILLDEIATSLGHQLPDYMVPARFHLLDQIPLNSYGKRDRQSLRDAISRRSPGPTAKPEEGSTLERLQRIWCQVLRTTDISPHDHFIALGGDSILSIQIATRAYRAGLRISPQDVFECSTLANLAARSEPIRHAASPAEAVVGFSPLTPVQRWLLEDSGIAEPSHFNQSILLRSRRTLDPIRLADAIHRLIRHHDVLRSRFEPSTHGWRQVFESNAEWGAIEEAGCLGHLDLSQLQADAARRAASAAASRAQASLDIKSGPLLRALHIDLGPVGCRLLIVIHHLVVDAVSWSLLVTDLERLYRRLTNGRPPDLPAKTTSYRAWSLLQAEYADSDELDSERAYWVSTPGSRLPRDFTNGENSLSSVDVVSVHLDATRTRQLLRRVPAAYRTQIGDILLTALARTMSEWAGPVTVDLESHGREEKHFEGIDLSRTVGWFTSTFPVHFDLRSRHLGEDLVYVKELLRQVPCAGLGYGILRYLARNKLRVSCEMSFNYLGQLDALLADSQLWELASEPRGNESSNLGKRSYALEIDGGVVDSKLWVHWRFSKNLHRRTTIERLATAFIEQLQELIAHCLSEGAGRLTPSDVSLAGLDRQGLDALLASRASRPSDVVDIYPLSPIQEGMLFHALRAPHSAIYFEQASWRIDGALDVDALRDSWNQLVAHHPILRTSFAWEGLERPLQLVHRQASIRWSFVDWRKLDKTDQLARRDELFQRDRALGFDLERPPLMRLALLRTGPTRHRLLWSFHHLLVDGWSIAILFDELFELYRARVDHLELRLTHRPSPKVFIGWLEQQEKAAAEDFWRRELKGLETSTRILTPCPSGQEAVEVREARLSLKATVTAALAASNRQRQVTLGTLLRAAWALLVSRLAGGVNEAVFGATVAGRPASLPDADKIVSLLINTLPIRIATLESSRLAPWLEGIQEQGLELLRWAHTPLVDIQACSNIPSKQPLFESLMVVENYPTDVALEADQMRHGLEIGKFLGYSQTNYPLTLGVLPGPRLTFELSFDPSRIESALARRLLRYLEVLLGSLIDASPEDRLGGLQHLPKNERQQILFEWNDRHLLAPRNDDLMETFAHWALQAPDAVALIDETSAGSCSAVTYGPLFRRISRLSRILVEHGVGAETRVGVVAEYSIETVVAILSILEVGGTYVPLDPSHPQKRLEQICATCRLHLIVSAGRATGLGIPHLDSRFTSTTSDEPKASGQRPRPSPHHLAYILHTSGSTGQPKGVMVTRKNLLSTLAGWQADYALREKTSRHLQIAPWTFDVASGDLLRSLGSGRALVIARRETLLSPGDLQALMTRQRVDACEMVPAIAESLVQHCEMTETRVDSLRLLAVGSDLWRMKDLRRLKSCLHPRARLVSSYGVTEATIDSSFFDPSWGSSSRELTAERPVPIGRPFAHASLYVLDRNSLPVAAGVEGELHLGGRGLARGYAGQPALTAWRFLPDPFGGTGPGQRRYRTGDRVRRLADGQLEMLGRIDSQIKIRGMRIEPVEIEAALRNHPAIAEAVVTPRQDPNPFLVAWLRDASSGNRPQHSELRDFLAQRLPGGLTPNRFAWIDTLPLTPSGKIDRAALSKRPIPEADCTSAGSQPPVTATEIDLAKIWSRLLSVDLTSRDDDFFLVGGHSLFAIRLQVLVQQHFDVDLPLAVLFRHPSLRQVAAFLDQQRRPKPAQLTVESVSSDSRSTPALAHDEAEPQGLGLRRHSI